MRHFAKISSQYYTKETITCCFLKLIILRKYSSIFSCLIFYNALLPPPPSSNVCLCVYINSRSHLLQLCKSIICMFFFCFGAGRRPNKQTNTNPTISLFDFFLSLHSSSTWTSSSLAHPPPTLYIAPGFVWYKCQLSGHAVFDYWKREWTMLSMRGQKTSNRFLS